MSNPLIDFRSTLDRARKPRQTILTATYEALEAFPQELFEDAVLSIRRMGVGPRIRLYRLGSYKRMLHDATGHYTADIYIGSNGKLYEYGPVRMTKQGITYYVKRGILNLRRIKLDRLSEGSIRRCRDLLDRARLARRS